MRITFFFLAIVLAAVSACSHDIANEVSDAVPINAKWDVSRKDNLIEQNFSISKYYPYLLCVEFTPKKPLSEDEVKKLRDFMGNGNYQIWDETSFPSHVIHPSTLKEIKSAWDNIHQGKYELKATMPGTIIPIQIRIERTDSDKKTTIINQSINTQGLEGGGGHGLSRFVSSIALKPGKYTLIANPLQSTILPGNIETFLLLKMPVNVKELKDEN